MYIYIFLDCILGEESSGIFLKEPVAVFSSQLRKQNQSLQILCIFNMCRAQHIFNNKMKRQEKIRIHSCLVFPRDYPGKLFLPSSYHSRKMQDSCILCHICQFCEEVLGILTTLSLHVAVTKINFLDNLNIRSQIIFFQ